MASHNGSQFIAEQISSIQAQTHQDWTLHICDDHSSDDTKLIVKELAKKDNRINLIESPLNARLGVKKNFALLIEHALKLQYDYYFFADQDDVWVPAKLEVQLAQFDRTDNDCPQLIHHDLVVVNKDLEPIRDSYFSLMKIIPSNASLASLLGRNVVTGCTIACNKKLLEIASPIHSKGILHDWWLALTCSAFGVIQALPDRLVHYRQHSSNSIGARGIWQSLKKSRTFIDFWKNGDQEFIATIEQAKGLREHIEKKHLTTLLSKRDTETLVTYSRLLEFGRLKRLKIAIDSNLLKSQWQLKVANVLRILCLKKR